MQGKETEHKISILNRSRISITGVEDVECFNEELVVVTTSQGEMTLSGAGLKVSSLDLSGGELEISGRVDALEYGTVKKSGFFRRLAK